MEPEHGTWARNAYRTKSAHEMAERHLVLRGGTLDGGAWTGVVAVGRRVFCGTGTWSTEGMYLVTGTVEVDAAGVTRNVAIPAFVPDAAAG